jgi:hypothetical protein
MSAELGFMKVAAQFETMEVSSAGPGKRDFLLSWMLHAKLMISYQLEKSFQGRRWQANPII